MFRSELTCKGTSLSRLASSVSSVPCNVAPAGDGRTSCSRGPEGVGSISVPCFRAEETEMYAHWRSLRPGPWVSGLLRRLLGLKHGPLRSVFGLEGPGQSSACHLSPNSEEREGRCFVSVPPFMRSWHAVRSAPIQQPHELEGDEARTVEMPPLVYEPSSVCRRRTRRHRQTGPEAQAGRPIEMSKFCPPLPPWLP